MSSKEHAERLAHALDSLPFVTALNAEFGSSNVQILCRIQKGAETKWAHIVEKILLAAEANKGRECYWVSHICRLYFVRDGKMVYGWHVGITSNFMSETLGELIRSFISERVPTQLRAAPPPKHLAVPSPSSVRRQAAAPESDPRGNPKVPPHHRVEEIPMAGLDPYLDRNYPNREGVGAHGMFGSQRLGNPFKPPTGGSGIVGG